MYQWIRNTKKREQMECKMKVKQVIEESKRREDKDFERWLSEKYKKNRRLYIGSKLRMEDYNSFHNNNDGKILKAPENLKEDGKYSVQRAKSLLGNALYITL